MSDYVKSYQIADHTVTISWGPTTPPVVTWSPPITDEQRQRVESSEAYEDLMMTFIGDAAAAVHGTEVIRIDPDTLQATVRHKGKWRK